MDDQKFEKFAAMIHDKSNPSMKRILTTDAMNESQAAKFLERGADKMGYALTDGHIYKQADLPPNSPQGKMEYRSPVRREPIRASKKIVKPKRPNDARNESSLHDTGNKS